MSISQCHTLQAHQIIIRRNVTLLWVFVVLIQPIISSVTGKSEEILYASNLHQELCEPLNDSVLSANKCCGFCNTDIDCAIYGTCCLRAFESFDIGKLSLQAARYECVLPQFITSRESTLYATASSVKPVLMISRCHPNFIRYGTEEFCENPGFHDSIYSVLPVRKGSVDYRNIFCAHCNGVDLLLLNNWRMEIHCDDAITVTDFNFFNTIRNKKCNIFYKPPSRWFQNFVPCSIPQYKINRCNETGLWSSYNETIKQACDSFVDPFNFTYRNYFCYLCNAHDVMPRENWNCPDPLQKLNDEHVRPVYTLTPDISLLTKQRNKDTGCDLKTEFLDYKMKLCRDKLCHPDRRLAHYNCMLKLDLPSLRPCVATYVKITALDGINLRSRLKQDQAFLYELRLTLHQNMQVYSVVIKIDIFVDSEWNDRTQPYVDYFIIKLLLIDPIYPNDMLEKLLLNVHQKTLRLAAGQERLFFELATYYENFNDAGKRIIHVPLSNNHTSTTLGWFSSIEFSKNNVKYCNNFPLSSMHKTHVCPYVQLKSDEFVMDFSDEFLVLKSDDMTSKFSPFEYQLQNDSVFICLSDFLPFYHSLSTPETASVNRAGMLTRMIYLTVCIKMSCLIHLII